MARVSVIVPNYNHAAYLPHRLDSIYDQTFPDFDVVILDDASTDDSLSVIERYAGRPRTRVIASSTNSGSVFRQWERGIAASHSEYIWIAESDDIASIGLLSSLVPLLDRDLSLSLAYAQSWMIDLQGRITGDALDWTQDIDPQRWRRSYASLGVDEIRRGMTIKNTIPNASAVLIRRSLLEAAGGVIQEPMRLCGDWLQWVRLLRHGGVAYNALHLNHWRQASSNARHRINGILEWKEGRIVLDEACDGIGADELERLRIKHRFLERCWAWQRDSGEALLAEFRAAKAEDRAAHTNEA